MIYTNPPVVEAIDQGDLIDRCQLSSIGEYSPGGPAPSVDVDFRRVIVMTQTCDLANQKTLAVIVAEV